MRQLVAYSTGVVIEIVALARDLNDADADRLQARSPSLGNDGEAQLLVGVELDGSRLLPQPLAEATPGTTGITLAGADAVLGAGRLCMTERYWLRPAPLPVAWRVFAAWPYLGVPLGFLDIRGAAVANACAASRSVWL